jgi:hypothetical protein
MITVAIAYEGLDVPNITHLICLTHIRSAPWLMQCLSRSTRFSPVLGPYEKQLAFVFAPSDPLFDYAVDYIHESHQWDSAIKEDSDLILKNKPNRIEFFKVQPITSNLLKLCSTSKIMPVYDHETLKENFLKSNLNVVQFCELHGIPKNRGHVILRGLNSRVFLSKEEVVANYKKYIEKMPLGTKIQFAKEIYPDHFHKSVTKKIKEFKSFHQNHVGLDWVLIQNHYDSKKLSVRQYVKDFGEQYNITYHQAKKHLKSNYRKVPELIY